ncbi:MAG: CopG family transcriptional regulator, partial [Nostoc sp.]
MNKKWAIKRITINLASVESEKLERYCAMTGRPATDVIRELIRSLSITELSASEQTTSTLK